MPNHLIQRRNSHEWYREVFLHIVTLQRALTGGPPPRPFSYKTWEATSDSSYKSSESRHRWFKLVDVLRAAHARLPRAVVAQNEGGIG